MSDRLFVSTRKGLFTFDRTNGGWKMGVDESGDRLAFGSSTGGLWTSDDGGESWTCLSAHLPQVYAVRFA